MSLKNHIIRVFGLLNERAEYAVLRNYEELPERNESRDIDIIITRRGFRSIKRELVDTLCQEGWRIVTYLNSDRLITFVCAKMGKNEKLRNNLCDSLFYCNFACEISLIMFIFMFIK